MWHDTGHRAEVTCIVCSPQRDCFAVGYTDGSIRLWSPSNGSVISVFNGHKRAVTALAFDEKGARLASGSQDTDLIVWDVLAETGLVRCVSPLYVAWVSEHRIPVYAGTEIKSPSSDLLPAMILNLRWLLPTVCCSRLQRTHL
jgi:WD40 repeat protein